MGFAYGVTWCLASDFTFLSPVDWVWCEAEAGALSSCGDGVLASSSGLVLRGLRGEVNTSVLVSYVRTTKFTVLWFVTFFFLSLTCSRTTLLRERLVYTPTLSQAPHGVRKHTAVRCLAANLGSTSSLSLIHI